MIDKMFAIERKGKHRGTFGIEKRKDKRGHG